MKIYALTCCVDYSHLLARGIDTWKKNVERLVVVTHPSDAKTIALCKKYDVEVHVTAIMFANGAMFNKGAAMAEAAHAFHLTSGEADWVLCFDADIVPPDDLNAQLTAANLNPRKIYGVERYQIEENSPIPPIDAPKRIKWPTVVGFFMLFQASNPRVPHPLFSLDIPHAGFYDDEFVRRWPREEQEILPVKCFHLGENARNWCGVGEDAKMDAFKKNKWKPVETTTVTGGRMKYPPKLYCTTEQKELMLQEVTPPLTPHVSLDNNGRITERSVVLTLPHRPHRLEHFNKVHEPIFGKGFSTPFYGCTPDTHPKPTFLNLPLGHYACLMSMLEILRFALIDKVNSLTVFEDDNLVGPLAPYLMRTMLGAMPASSVALWYCVDLARWHTESHLNGAMRRVTGGWRMNCYLIPDRANIQRLYDHTLYHFRENTQVDAKLSYLATKAMVYAPSLPVCAQERTFVSDTDNKDRPLDRMPIVENELKLKAMIEAA